MEEPYIYFNFTSPKVSKFGRVANQRQKRCAHSSCCSAVKWPLVDSVCYFPVPISQSVRMEIFIEFELVTQFG